MTNSFPIPDSPKNLSEKAVIKELLQRFQFGFTANKDVSSHWLSFSGVPPKTGGDRLVIKARSNEKCVDEALR